MKLSRNLESIPRFAVTALIILAIVNLLVGVFLRYVVGGITDYLDMDPVPFVWVEEVGELALAWLTLIGAAIGIRQRSHFTLHILMSHFSKRWQQRVDRFNHLLILVFGLVVAWYGVGLSRLNMAITTPGLEINMAWLYLSSVAGGLLIALYSLLMMLSAGQEES